MQGSDQTEEQVLALLGRGDLRPLGLMRGASNGTFLCELTAPGVQTLAIYKPREGEAPLWDFPSGTLALREVAAYVVSAASGWSFVPPTILRDGPMGPGAVQLFIDAEPGEHYLTLAPGREDVFRAVAAYDILINNADRKSGHCLLQKGGDRIWLIDHGVTFHALPKLRTVIWDFEGEPLTPDVRQGLEAVAEGMKGSLRERLGDLLSAEEVGAFEQRVAGLLAEGVFPSPGEGRPYPWPPI